MSKVFITDYQENLDLSAILEKQFSRSFAGIQSNDTVLLKPNMFMTDEYYYTNPELLVKCAAFFKEFGARVVISERLKVLYEVLEKVPAIKKYAEIISLEDVPKKLITIDNATSLRQEIEIPSIITDCDFFVNVPQFRTHAGVLMSNALKNMVGILPGYTTRIVHNVGLTEAIVDLNRIRPQNFVISDIITTIEGNYPISGEVVHRNKVVVGDNPVAVDIVTAKLSGFDYKDIKYIQKAAKEGMGPGNINEISICGGLEEHAFNCIKSGDLKDTYNNKITFDYGSACAECKRYCHSLGQLIDENLELNDQLTIISGVCQNDLPEQYSKENTIFVGNCSYMQREYGVFLEGCPPRALQGMAVLKWLSNKEDLDEKFINQCRWPI